MFTFEGGLTLIEIAADVDVEQIQRHRARLQGFATPADDGMIRACPFGEVGVSADVAWSYVTDTSKLDSW